MSLYHLDNIADKEKKSLVEAIEKASENKQDIISKTQAIIKKYAEQIEEYLKTLSNDEVSVKEDLTSAINFLNEFKEFPDVSPEDTLNELSKKLKEISTLSYMKADNANYQNHPKVQGFFRSLALAIRKILDKILTKAGIDNNLFNPEPQATMFSLQRDLSFSASKIDGFLNPESVVLAAQDDRENTSTPTPS